MPKKAEEASEGKEPFTDQIFHKYLTYVTQIDLRCERPGVKTVLRVGKEPRGLKSRAAPSCWVSADTEHTTEQADTKANQRDDAEQEQERVTRDSLADVSSPTHGGGEDGRHIGDDRCDRDSSSRLDRIPSFRRFQTRGLMIIRTALTMKIKQIRPKR